MSPADLERQLAAYLAVRQALGYAMRAERTLLADFVGFLIDRGNLSPIRAQSTGPPGEQTNAARRALQHV